MLLAKDANHIATYSNVVEELLKSVESSIVHYSKLGQTNCCIVVRLHNRAIESALLDAGYTVSVITKTKTYTKLRVEW